MHARGPEPDSVAYGSGIVAASTGRQWGSVLALLDGTRERGIGLSPIALGSAVSAFERTALLIML